MGPDRICVDTFSTLSISVLESRTVGTMRVTSRSTVTSNDDNFPRPPSAACIRRWKGRAATAMMMPQVMVVINGLTIWKHQTTRRPKMPRRTAMLKVLA